MKTPLIRVLLIEDKTADADLIQEGLKGQSAQFYEVATVADLTTAIEHLKTSLPDIILTNLNLPDSTGIATVLALRTAAPHLPIVVMAGEDHVEGVGLEVIRAGAQDYFLKNQQDSGYLSRTLRYALERQKIAHQQLESINHYQLVSEVASDYRFSAKVDESGKVTQNLPTGAIEKITGYSAEEFLKTGGWRAHLHPDDLWINDRNQEQLYQDHSIDSEIRMLRKDGSVAWVQVFVSQSGVKNPIV